MQKVIRVILGIAIFATVGVFVGQGLELLRERGAKEVLADLYETEGERALRLYLPEFSPEKRETPVQLFLRRAEQLLPRFEKFLQAAEPETLVEDDETRDEIIEAVEEELKEQMIQENQIQMLQEENALARQKKEEPPEVEKKPPLTPVVEFPMEKLQDFNYLLNQFFVVDPNTTGEPWQLQYEKLAGVDCHLEKKSGAPQILIYHTHSQEGFADSKEGDSSTGVIGIGNVLAELLEKEYGYEVLHLTNTFDLVDGRLERSKAYNYAAPVIEETLKQNPSIEVVIDLHRDGVPENKHLVTEIDGKPTAKIMFFNGLSRTREKGENPSLPNPYIGENLGFSFQLAYMAKRCYPDFVRCVYLKGYRYNLHFRPKSLLLEVGAQTNTVEEAKNAMEVFARLLDRVLEG